MTSTKSFLAALFLVANSLLAATVAFSDPRELESLRAGIDFRGTATVAGTAESLSLSLYSVPDGVNNCTVPVETDSEGKYFVRFSWARPGAQASYGYSCTVETGGSRAGLLRDEPIPSAGFGNYTAPSELVQVTPEIASKAQELIAAVDGEFLAASLLASWVHANMKYDKSYFGRVLDSRQVFEGMTGVCEEYSHLLLAMLRSVGIPSRYVTGLVYGQDGWAPHAWVEAFFPGQNRWVPFDPTYAEYGYVDASHIRFFDSTDGGFAASRTGFTYNAFGPRPSVKWDEANPVVRVESERAGSPLFEASAGQAGQVVRVGGYAMVKAGVRNAAGGLAYVSARLVYQVKNLGEGDNLELAFGNETVFVELAPGEAKNLYWVLKVRSRYAIAPKVLVENLPVDAGNITGSDDAPPAALELFSDRDGYGTDETARVTAEAKGPRATITVTELTTGAHKAVGANGRAEFDVPARNGQAAVYSSAGAFARIPLALHDGSGLDARLDAPERVVAGHPFGVAIFPANPAMQLKVGVSGYSPQTVTAGGALRFNHTLNESGALTVTVFSEGGDKFTFRKYVEVLPAPELVPSAISRSGRGYSFTIQMRNGLLSSAKTSGGQSSYESISGYSGRLSFTDKSAKCGKRLELQVEAATRDLLGQDNLETYGVSSEVKCGPLETLIQRILDFFFAKSR